MSLRWFTFETRDGAVVGVAYLQTLSDEAAEVYGRGYVADRPQGRVPAISAKDELDAFMLATKWLEKGEQS